MNQAGDAKSCRSYGAWLFLVGNFPINMSLLAELRKSSFSRRIPLVHHNAAVVSHQQKNLTLQIAVGCRRHRPDDPALVRVLLWQVGGVVGPCDLALFDLCFRDLLDSRPVAMVHQFFSVLRVTIALVTGGAATQKRSD